MKRFSIFLSVTILTITFFSALSNISTANRYSSVRKYAKPKPDVTPPLVEFVSPSNGDVVRQDTVDVRVRVSDDRTPAGKLIVKGDGKTMLKKGFNPIVATATDEA